MTKEKEAARQHEIYLEDRDQGAFPSFEEIFLAGIKWRDKNPKALIETGGNPKRPYVERLEGANQVLRDKVAYWKKVYAEDMGMDIEDLSD